MSEDKFENLSGRHLDVAAKIEAFAERAFPIRQDQGKALKSLSPEETRQFWTGRRKELGTQAFDALVEDLAPLGVRQNHFSPSFFDLFHFSEFNAFTWGLGQKPSYAHTGMSGRIRLPVYDGLNDAKLALLILHEGGHFFEARIVKPGNWLQTIIARVVPEARIHRRGTMMALRDSHEIDLDSLFGKFLPTYQEYQRSLAQAGAPGNMESIKTGLKEQPYVFSYLDEGINQKSTLSLFARKFPNLVKLSDRETPYQFEVWMVDEMVNLIFEKRPERYANKEEVFKLFKMAIYGDGNWLPLARAIENTWGDGSFKDFADIMRYYDYVFQNWGGHPCGDAINLVKNFLASNQSE